MKNLIFDFGNVVIRFDPYYMSSAVTDNEEEKQILMKTVFNPVTFELTDRGYVNLEKSERSETAALADLLDE